MNLLVRWLLSAVVIVIAAYLVPGVSVAGFTTALVLAVVLGVLNLLVKPILLLLTLPVNILTLGLFTFVINVILIYLAASLVSGFKVSGFIPALLFSIVMAILGAIINV